MNNVSRRAVLSGAGAGVALASVNARPAAAVTPTNLPSGIYPRLASYQNWAKDINVSRVWTVSIGTRSKLVELVNWAAREGWRIRPTGFRHNWSPTTVSGSENADTKVMLVDTRDALTGISVTTGSQATVRVGAGVSMDDLMSTLYLYGLGFNNIPAPGDITVGGALAIDGHGTSVPRFGESLKPGTTWGTLSNLVTSIRAIVYDSATGQYVAKEFGRNQVESAVLMCHVGRAFVTDVTLRVGRQQNLRCVTRTDLSAAELFAQPGTAVRTFDSLLAQGGRVETIWFPFTNNPWTKVWYPDNGILGLPPLGALPTLTPYNYYFADNPLNELLQGFTNIQNDPSQVRTLSALAIGQVNLNLLQIANLWGPAYHTQLYVRPTTLKVTANGYAVVCNRISVQKVIADAVKIYKGLLDSWALAGRYPINGPLEIRASGVDKPADVGISGAKDVWLSAARRIPLRPDLDTVVWFDVLTQPGTPGAAEFYTLLEAALYARFNGIDAVMRVEWSKGWGYTSAGAWSNDLMMKGTIPGSLTLGQVQGETFYDAVNLLNTLDPKRVYASPMLDRLLPA